MARCPKHLRGRYVRVDYTRSGNEVTQARVVCTCGVKHRELGKIKVLISDGKISTYMESV